MGKSAGVLGGILIVVGCAQQRWRPRGVLRSTGTVLVRAGGGVGIWVKLKWPPGRSRVTKQVVRALGQMMGALGAGWKQGKPEVSWGGRWKAASGEVRMASARMQLEAS